MTQHGGKDNEFCANPQSAPELANSLKEIREFARQDRTARPQIVSRRFPGNLEWAKYTRSEQTTMLGVWRTTPQVRGAGEVSETSARHSATTSNPGGEAKAGRPSARAPTTLGKETPYPREASTAVQAGRRDSKPRRTGKDCGARRGVRRVYDSLCLRGYSFAHLAFEAHFEAETIKEAREYYEREKKFNARCHCGNRAVNFATTTSGSVRNCYRCGEDESIETPAWLQVRTD